MQPSTVAPKTLGMKAAHHQRGVLPSTMVDIWSDIQPRLRWLATKGSRSSSRGGAETLRVEEASAISVLLSCARLRIYGRWNGRRHGLQKGHLSCVPSQPIPSCSRALEVVLF